MRATLWMGLLALGPLGCAPAPAAPAANDDLTTIVPTAPIQQSVPNCWDFATTSWIESLAVRPAGGAAVDLSEGYVSFVYWFFQIMQPGFTAVRPEGSWGTAVEISRRFGWMSEQDFLSQSSPVDYAVRHRQALESLRLELLGGELKAPEQRQDAKHVFAVLSRLWQLKPEVTSEIATIFGEGLERTLIDPAVDVAGTHVHRLSEIPVGYAPDGAAVTAADLVGEPGPGIDTRVGPFAYSNVAAPAADADVRAYLQRAQKSLNQDMPVVMTLMQDDTQLDATGTYQRPPSGALSPSAYSHLVTVFDLSVHTSEFGLLAAGVPETRPEALAASLRPDSTPTVLRARNPFWGSYDPGATLPFAGSVGTNDYTLEYLMMPLANQGRRVVWGLTLPNDPDVVISKVPPAPAKLPAPP